YVIEVLQRKIFVRTAEDFGRRLPAVRHEVWDNNHGPELTNRFFDVLTIQKTLSALLLDGLSLALQTILGMVLLGFYHPLLLAFDVVLFVLLIAVLALGRGAVATGYRESSAKYRTAAWLQDISHASHLFRTDSAQRYAAHRTQMLCHDYLAARKQHFRILLRQVTGGIGLQVFTMVALLSVGGFLVIGRQLTLGQLVAAELVIATVGASFVKLGKNLEKLYDLNVGVMKVTDVVEKPTVRVGGAALRGRGPMHISLREVACTRGALGLHNINLDLMPGDRLHLTGPAGSGKTTLLEVIAGLRLHHTGVVLVDGVDSRRVNLADFSSAVAIIHL
ncbi:MAG: ATP-binding cassette domain-containing protein, partial [Nannocystaceae bacterium]